MLLDKRLSDTERKMFRILLNLSLQHRVPSVKGLCRLSCRTQEQVLDALSGLAQKQYIEWDEDDPDSMKLLKTKEGLIENGGQTGKL